MIDLQNIQQYREDNRLEAKQAQKGLPVSVWETYSAFANTDGGLILLGVMERGDHSLDIVGVDDPEKMVSDFWNTINNPQKINVNILTNHCVQVVRQNGKAVVAIDVPRADRTMKPVFVGTDPMRGSYRRNGEGDYHCNKDQVAAMYRDASVVGVDMRVLTNMDMTVFDMESIHAYRNRFASFHPNHIWLNLDDELFLRRIGAMSLSDDDQKIHPTVAGLLMFGYEYEILREFPNYFLDYQERLDDNARWSNRIVSSSGEWSGNLFDFFFKVFSKLADGLPRPFVMRESSRIDETPLHEALRELLLNALVHADHYGRQGIVIVKAKDFYSFSNPGDIRIGLKVALSGGFSDSRNSVIMKMFALIDKVERAGMGIPQAIDSWQNLLRVMPYYRVTYNPERTTLRLEVETLFDTENVLKVTPREYTDNHRYSIVSEDVHDPKDFCNTVYDDDPKNEYKGVCRNYADIQLNNEFDYWDVFQNDDPKNDPKNDPKRDPKNGPKKKMSKNIDNQNGKSVFEVYDDPKNDPNKLTDRQKSILLLVNDDGSITMEKIAQKLGVSLKTVKRDMSQLQIMNQIKRVGSRTKGEWKVLE